MYDLMNELDLDSPDNRNVQSMSEEPLVDSSEEWISKKIVWKHMSEEMKDCEPLEKDIRKNEKETYPKINI